MLCVKSLHIRLVSPWLLDEGPSSYSCLNGNVNTSARNSAVSEQPLDDSDWRPAISPSTWNLIGIDRLWTMDDMDERFRRIRLSTLQNLAPLIGCTQSVSSFKKTHQLTTLVTTLSPPKERNSIAVSILFGLNLPSLRKRLENLPRDVNVNLSLSLSIFRYTDKPIQPIHQWTHETFGIPKG